MNKGVSNRNAALPIILIAIGVLLITGVVIWQMVLRPANISQASANDTTPAAQAIPDPNIQRVPLTEAKTAFDNKTAVFVDVRDSDSYHAGHIPGAINIPLADMETRYKELDPNQWIITYCT